MGIITWCSQRATAGWRFHPSQFAREAGGLELVRAIMPDETPFRAWSNFEFRDSRGRWHEVDLLLLGHGRLHLVELKYYSGTLRGDDQRWARDGRRPEDSPLKLTQRKAQNLKSKLVEELRQWAQEQRVTIPMSVTSSPSSRSRCSSTTLIFGAC